MASEAEITRHMAALRQEIRDYSRVFLAVAALGARWKAGVTDAVSPPDYGEELMLALAGQPLPGADPATTDPDDQPGPEHRALAKVANAAGEVASEYACSGTREHDLLAGLLERFRDEIRKAMHQ